MPSKNFFSLFIAFFLFHATEGQSLQAPPSFEQVSDFDFSLRMSGLMIQANYQHLHRLNPENQFRMGYGLSLIRYRSFADISYTALGADSNNSSGRDSLQVENPAISSLNLFLLLNYAPNDRLDFGLAIDVLGIGWGPPQDAVLASGRNDNNPLGALAEPVLLNTSLLGWGAWRSQIQLRYWLFDRWALQGGMTYWISAYEVTDHNAVEEKQFTQGALFGKIGISFRW